MSSVHGILVTRILIEPILTELKIQTRRILNPQPDETSLNFRYAKTPFRVGDRLWVRERHWCWGYWEDVPGKTTKTGKQKRQFVRAMDPDKRNILFDQPDKVLPNSANGVPGWYQRPGLFMFQKDSRMVLTVTDVRIQRLQEISEHDASCEGVQEVEEIVDMGSTPSGHPQEIMGLRYRVIGFEDDEPGREDIMECFADFWDSLNKDRGFSWDDNPWVAAYTFKLTGGGADG